jgi:hypothetical protein
MNQVVPFNPQQSQIAAAPSFTMSDMERVALAIAKGGLFGSTDPNAVLTLCMLAQAEGQHPAVVFRDYHIIQGKPAKKAEAMHRDFLAAGGKIEWHQCDDDCADATFSHPQGGSMRITWDNARVAQAQLGGNPMHKKYPRAMKRSRVISEGVRAVFPMATSGLYETGEVQDIVADSGPAVPATPEPKRARNITAEAGAGRGKAEAWVADQIATVENAADLEALDTIMAGGSKAVAKLAREHADLHDRVQAAYQKRSAELQGYNGETGEAEPDFLARIASAADAADLGLIEQDYRAAMHDMPKALADQVEAALAARKGEIDG